jgi:hypothetical protein
MPANKCCADMPIELLRAHVPVSDAYFDTVYRSKLRKASQAHFTPVPVAALACAFLTGGALQGPVLDIGAGAGKFCLTGAAMYPQHVFHGVEVRARLVGVANKVARRYQLHNAIFAQGNALDWPIADYGAAYLFNPFYEYLFDDDRIDPWLPFDKSEYRIFSEMLAVKLAQMPVGSRLATFYCESSIVPECFVAVEKHVNGKLIFWEKRACG